MRYHAGRRDGAEFGPCDLDRTVQHGLAKRGNPGMSSNARKAFDQNAGDIKRLLEIHRDLGGDARGRRFRLEVLNKSAIVLITSFWEAYCEDIAAEALDHVVEHAQSSKVLPKGIKQIVAKELKDSKHDLAVWDLSDGGWRTILRKRLKMLQDTRNRRLNTPKSVNIDQLFLGARGLGRVSDSWRWDRMKPDRARRKLDNYVTLRGEIAHRGTVARSCTKDQVTDYFRFARELVGKTGGRVNRYVKDITGRALW